MKKIGFLFLVCVATSVWAASSHRADEAVRRISSVRLPEQDAGMAQARELGKDAVPALIEALKDPNAIEGRGRITDTLQQVLHNPANRTIQFLDALEKTVQLEDYSISDAALNVLTEYTGNARVLAILRKAIVSHPNEYTRTEAIGRLLRFSRRDRNHSDVYQRALLDPSPFVRADAAGALGLLGDKSGYSVAIECLKEPRAAYGAILALGRIGDPQAIPLLESLYADPHGENRGDAQEAIKEIQYGQLKSDGERLNYLKEAFAVDGNISTWAAIKLGKLDDSRALKMLKEAAEDMKHPAYEASVRVLSKRGLLKVE